MTTQSERLRIAEVGMYRPEFESDACGVGEHIHKYLKAKVASERIAA